MSGKLKVGITCYPTFGGSGIIASELGLALAESGHEVHFITSRLPARLRSHKYADISFHEVNTFSYALFRHEPYTLALAAKMAEVAETFALDLLHVHYAIPHAISAHVAREIVNGNLRVVTTLHGTDITLVGSDPSLRTITRFAIDSSDAVTAVSHWLKQETEKEFSPQVPVQVVRNFIDPQVFNPGISEPWRGSHHACGEHPHIVHVSNFRSVKRAPDAVEVFAKVLPRIQAHLLMVGDGPDLQTAIQRAKNLGVTEYVSFLGNREDIPCLLAASEILLMPSESESFGLSALEAMACGCAVVATRIGGLPELIHHGKDGYLCNVGDIAEMADLVCTLLSSESQLVAMQKAAQVRAVQDYSISKILPQYIAVYEEALEKRVGNRNA